MYNECRTEIKTGFQLLYNKFVFGFDEEKAN